MKNLIVAATTVVATLVVTSLPLGQRAASAQVSAAAARPWKCLAAAHWGLGIANGDAACARAAQRIIQLPSPLGISAPQVVPGAPGALTASVSGGTVVLSWAAPTTGDAPTAYVVEAGSASGRIDLANSDTGSTAPTLTALDVPPGSYFVRVRARSAAGTSAASNEVVVTVQSSGGCTTAPGAPGTLSAVVAGTSLTLTWAAPSGGCAPTAYVIEAGSVSGLSNLASFSTGNTATTFSAAGIGSGTYYVRVRASNSGGTSAASNEVQFTVGAAPCPGPPAAPTGFTSTVSGTTIVLAWAAPSGSVLSYILEAGSAPGLSNLVVSDTGNVTSLTATAGAGTYYVRLRARNACGMGGASTEITVVVGSTTPGNDNVSIITADMGGNRLVRVSDMNGSNFETGPTGSTVPSIPQGSRTLNAPWHFSMDSRGRFYIADRDNNRIVRMDDLSGNGFKTFSGVGSNTLAFPGCDGGSVPPVGCVISVATDSAGRIYIVASGAIIRIDDMDGTGWTRLGGPGSRPGDPISFAGPKVLIFDAQGRMLVSDSAGHRLVRFNDMQGTGWTTFGSEGSGVGQFRRPEGLALDALGRIYIADHTNHRVVRIDDMTGAGWVSFGSFGNVDPARPIGTAVGQFSEPHDVAVSDSGKIYVLDTVNARVVRINDMSGAGWTTFGTRTIQRVGCTGPQDPLCTPPGPYEFVAPKGIWLARR